MFLIVLFASFFGFFHLIVGTFDKNDRKRFLLEANSLPPKQENVRKEYYTDSALNFLLNYGQHYRLFDMFFDRDDIVIQNKPSSNSHREKFIFKESEEEFEKKETEIIEQHSYNSDISEHYLIRDYSSFQTWSVANATVNEEYQHLNFDYTPKPNDPFFIDYSNRFRYGPNLNDRFFYIGLNHDIWEWKNPSSSFYRDLTNGVNPYFVYFIGTLNNLQEKLQKGDTFYCNFTFYDGEEFVHLSTEVEIQQDLRDVLTRPIDDNIVRCQVPIALLESLEIDHNHRIKAIHHHHNPHQQQFQQSISLHFSRSNRRGENAILLKDITIPRLHELDRRKYTYTIETLVETLEDSMVFEWIIYNILLGIEHFYFFLNTKDVKYSLEESILRPFLDANIITVIYYPYFHTDYGFVQRSAFNVHLLCFGKYQEWTSYSDVDELFLPSPQFLPQTVSAMRNGKKSILHELFIRLAPNDEPGVMFDTLEMDCPAHSNNYYHGGWNIRSLPTELQSSESNNKSTTSSSEERIRPAVTTHCHRTGAYFHEMTIGHGKMFIRPQKLRYLYSPHRLNEYSVVWTTAEHGGLFRHFDRFRYTFGLIHSHRSPPLEQIEGVDLSLKELTLRMLEAYLGITSEKKEKQKETKGLSRRLRG